MVQQFSSTSALQDNIKKFGEQLQAGNNNNKTANFEDFAGPTGEA